MKLKVKIKILQPIAFMSTFILSVVSLLLGIYLFILSNQIDENVYSFEVGKIAMLNDDLHTVSAVFIIFLLLLVASVLFNVFIAKKYMYNNYEKIENSLREGLECPMTNVYEINEFANALNTSQKLLKMERDLLKQEGMRFRAIVADKVELIFEYNVETKSADLVFSSNSGKFKIPNTYTYESIKDYATEKSVQDIVLNFEQCQMTKIRRSFECQLKGSNGEYHWCIATFIYMKEYDTNNDHYILVINDNDIAHEKESSLIAKAKLDPLTEIYNRNAFFERTNERLGICSSSTMLIMDCDYFKQVNDSHGHIVGDKILNFIAQAMKQIFRSTDIYGRLGGDEFIVFSSTKLPNDVIHDRFNKFNELVKQLCENGNIPPVSTSWGVVLSDNELDTNKLYDAADKALYSAKAEKRGSVVIVENEK